MTREFKGYQTHNEKRDHMLEEVYYLMDARGSGAEVEDRITEYYGVASVSELSTGTLLNIRERLEDEECF